MLPFIHVGDFKLFGILPIHPFGLLVATGVILGTNITLARARKRGIDLELLNSFITWMLVAGFIGGHMLDQIFYHPQEILRTPLTLVGLWLGLSSFGGFTGGLIGILLWRRLRSSIPKPEQEPTFGPAAQGFWLMVAGALVAGWRQVAGELPFLGKDIRSQAVGGVLAAVGLVLLLKNMPKSSVARRPFIGGALGLVAGGIVGTVAGMFIWRGVGKDLPFREDPVRVYFHEHMHLAEDLSAGLAFGAMTAVVGVGLGWFLCSIARRPHVIPVFPLADLILSVFPVAWIFGRSGCSVVHDHPGKMTVAESLLAVGYPAPGELRRDVSGIQFVFGSMHRYDLGLLELMFTIILSACIVLTWHKRLRTGTYIALVSLSYAPVRFGMDYLRIKDGDSADPRYGSLTPAQWSCIALFTAGLLVIAYMRRNKARGHDPINAVLYGRSDASSSPPLPAQDPNLA